jgi:hypothetical protein
MLYRQFANQEEIDKEYDVEESVPDFQQYAEFNVNESKKALQRGDPEASTNDLAGRAPRRPREHSEGAAVQVNVVGHVLVNGLRGDRLVKFLH